jgi:hypothetical protein
MKPNLFDIATKELCQDAFIAWLLDWANPENRKHDADLHSCAEAFVKKLLSLQAVVPDHITSVKVERQWKKIDVKAVVNDKYCLIIEDKTYTGQHSGQLKRYRDIAQEECRKENYILVCIYLKTGSECLSIRQIVENQNYAIFDRKNFIDALSQYDVKNDIFIDFIEQLKRIDNEESQYLKKIGKWNSSDWKGFYQELERRRSIDNWRLIPKKYWIAVLNWIPAGRYHLYMQIQEESFCFKVGEVHENRSEERNYYHNKLINSKGDFKEIEKPKRFGSGKYMTIANVGVNKWLIRKDDGSIDMDAVVSKLNRYESWLKSVAEEINDNR